MQDALHVDAHVAEEIAFRRRGAKRETEGEGRRRGKRGMSRSTRRRLVEIDGVGLARRMGEEFELALFDIDMARLGGESLEALVDHVRLLCLAEEGDDAGAAEAEIMLERMAGAFDLAPVGAAAQLMRAFEALRETRRAERMALGKQPARGVGDHLAAIAVFAIRSETRRVGEGGGSTC